MLCLDPAVENGTVTTLAQDLLVERSLTALTLDPKVAVFLLLLLQLLLPLDIDLLDAALTRVTDDFLSLSEDILASETCPLNHGVSEEASARITHCWLVNVSHMVS